MSRIDQSGNTRLSMNVSVDRQTPKSDFGDRIQQGLNSATGAIANGLAVAAPYYPGGAIVSAAVSSLGAMSQNSAVTSQYAATGVVSLGGGSPAGGPMTTTVGAGGTAVGGLGSAGGMPGAGSIVGNGGSLVGSSLGNAGSGLADQASQLGQMLQVQMQVQRENQVFTTVSNVLKTRHDTIKNTISNVR